MRNIRITRSALYLLAAIVGWTLGGCASIGPEHIENLRIEDGYVKGTFTNPVNRRVSVEAIEYALYDDAGERVGSGDVIGLSSRRMRPRESADFSVSLATDDGRPQSSTFDGRTMSRSIAIGETHERQSAVDVRLKRLRASALINPGGVVPERRHVTTTKSGRHAYSTVTVRPAQRVAPDWRHFEWVADDWEAPWR